MPNVKTIYGKVHAYHEHIREAGLYRALCGMEGLVGSKTWTETKESVTCQKCKESLQVKERRRGKS